MPKLRAIKPHAVFYDHADRFVEIQVPLRLKVEAKNAWRSHLFPVTLLSISCRNQNRMTLNEPAKFDLVLSGGNYELQRDQTKTKFTQPASQRGIAKLYTLSDRNTLIYVSIAKQPMAARLGYGMRANGKSGYWGYKWKDLERTVQLTVWTATVEGIPASLRELETVEAEVAFLCRQQSGQWPVHQHEIHFYPSSEWHRRAAETIYANAVGDTDIALV